MTTNKTGSKPGSRKPYAPPKLVSHGHVKKIVQGATGSKGDAGGTTKTCWIAEALYGPDDARTILLRAWLTGIHANRGRGWMFVELYRRTGPSVAALIRLRLIPRTALRPLFDKLAGKAVAATAQTIRDGRHRRAF